MLQDIRTGAWGTMAA